MRIAGIYTWSLINVHIMCACVIVIYLELIFLSCMHRLLVYLVHVGCGKDARGGEQFE